MPGLYLIALLAGIACMLLLDWRFRLFFWRDPVAASVVTVVGVVAFIAWDLAGIASGIFLRGDSTIATGVVLSPEMPLEEPIFLLFLVLCTMVIFTGALRIISAIAARKDRP